MKKLRGIVVVLILICFIIPLSLKAQIQTLDEFKIELESHWNYRDSSYQNYAVEELERFLSVKCQEGYHPFELIRASKMGFTKKTRHEYQELIESLGSGKVPDHKVDLHIKDFMDKYYKTSKAIPFVLTGVANYLLRYRCEAFFGLDDLNIVSNSGRSNLNELNEIKQSYLIVPPISNYSIIDLYDGVSSSSFGTGYLTPEDQLSSNGSSLQMATILPPGLTITMEMTGLVVNLFPVEHLVKIAERVK